MTTLTGTHPDLATFAADDGAVTEEFANDLRERFLKNDRYRLAQNALARTSIDEVALNRAVVTSTPPTFSHLLDKWTVTNQKKSGRCWMFAGLNLFRVGAMRAMNLENFEFSQNYTLFWDKFERSNYFLEAIIETAGRPVDDRTVAFLLDRPLEDGGQWNMFINLIRKHGVAPKSAMPETESSSNTPRMNGMLLAKLREGAKTLRDLHAEGATIEELRLAKRAILEAVHRILAIHLGTPPDLIDWQWNDKDRAFHREGEMTPQQFARRYIDMPIHEYVCLVHDPRETSPVNHTFTVKYLGNVIGGQPVIYLNVDINLMKRIAQETIENGEPVWMGCDVGKMMHRELGLWDAQLFDYETLYQTRFSLSKAERLVYHDTLMTHAMLFTGVDVIDGRARRWRVENSWGEEIGTKGFFTMNDSWFDEYVFEIAAHKSRLPEELIAKLDEEPIELPPWDPMGALAR